jgi:16S rRNA (cytosine967-C5)-methyltransferase
VKPFEAVWRTAIGTEPPESAGGPAGALTLTPARHGTDGFFVCVLERRA